MVQDGKTCAWKVVDKPVFTQTLLFTMAQLAGRIIGFFLLVVLAGNLLGARVYGVFANMDTYLMVMLIFSSFGTDLWLSRHAANHAVSWRDVWRMVIWRCGLAAAILALFALALQRAWVGSILVGHEPEMLVFFASLFFDHVALTCTAVLEGKQQLNKSAALSLSRWLVLGALGSVLLWSQADLMALCIAFLVASIARALCGLVLVTRQLQSTADSSIPFTPMIRAAMPMALMNFMVVLYFHIDVLMLPEMTSAQETGWYKIAVLMIEALLFISAGVATALYPLFSRTDVGLPAKVAHLYRGMRFLMILAFPIAWGTQAVAHELIVVMFPQKVAEYQNSGVALTWLVWALPAMFLNSSLVRLFLGLERQTRVLSFVSATALLNIVLNLVLIPKFGYLAACWTTILSEFTLTALFFFNLKRLLPSFRPFGQLWPPLVMSAVVLPIGLLTKTISISLAIGLSAAVYGLLILGSRMVTKKDLAEFAYIADGDPRDETQTDRSGPPMEGFPR